MNKINIFLSKIIMIVGIVIINLSWIVFLIIFAANIIFAKNNPYPWFALNTWSVFGTPLEFFISGLVLLFISAFLAYLGNK